MSFSGVRRIWQTWQTMNKTYTTRLGHVHVFIIGEAGSSTHQCAYPTLLIWTHLKLFQTFTTWFDFQTPSLVQVLFTGMVRWLFRLYYSSPTVPALPMNKDNDRYCLAMWDLFFEEEVESVSNHTTWKQILSIARMCSQLLSWWPPKFNLLLDYCLYRTT